VKSGSIFLLNARRKTCLENVLMVDHKNERQGVFASDLIAELVHQFSETLTFYRELVQNSIDAGSNRIEVSLQYEVLNPSEGRVVIRVEDDGEGMNEKIIDNYLTVLFRSTKAEDFTKIGKFGIGFVSVFALKPDLVRVSTARDGESWRIDFKSVEHFEKYRMPELRDGTLVEMLKRMTRQQYDALVIDSRASLRYWCRHSDTRITFCDRTTGTVEEITEPFDLEGGASVRYQEEGTEIVMAGAPTPEPFYGFYNRGLTLKEGYETFVPAVMFKIKSRYLDHTLTRDNVLRDENFEKAMKVVKRLARDELPSKVIGETAELAAKLSTAAAAGERAEMEGLSGDWGRRLLFLIDLFQHPTSSKRWSGERILPAIGGKPISLDQARRSLGADGRVLVDTTRTRVTDELDRIGQCVLWAGPWVQHVARKLIGGDHVALASSCFVFPRLMDALEVDADIAALLERVSAMDAASMGRYGRIAAADFAYPGSPIADEIFVIQNKAGELSPVGEPLKYPLLGVDWQPSAVINAAHTFVRRLAALHGSSPGLAAYLLLKTLYLRDDATGVRQDSALSEDAERTLLEAALAAAGAQRS
jgi:hypothetical protein